ncbi:MAG: hotdog fold thioesterase [Crocinitomicaceae bacterium]|nr:hotdog fold thioesterase [Crocinitomicaceae bacterium]
MKQPEEIIQLMLDRDAFSAWLNLNIIKIEKGNCTLSCTVNSQMLNGFDILHGGITYSLSDSALAFAANAYGYKCVSVETSISHLYPVKNNQALTITANEIHRGKSIGVYQVEILNDENQLISKFKGTVHISKDVW